MQIYFTGAVDNGNMAKKIEVAVQRPIRFPKWMFNSLEEIAQKQGLTFTSVVLELLRQELAVMGYTMGIGREAAEGGSEAGPVDKLAK
jgi:hypothetical protein